MAQGSEKMNESDNVFIEAGPGVYADKNFKIWYDDKLETLRIKNYYPLTKEDVTKLLPLVNKLLENRKHRCFLVDLSEVPLEKMVDKESRQAIRSYNDNKNFEKIAVFGASPVVRMIAKVMISVAGSSGMTRFFKSEDEAVDWIKGE
jgi:hypothetical protein